VGLAEPGQAGEATAAPESNVILLGQEAGPGPSAATPERAAAAPAGQEQAEATAHAGEAARTGAAPTKNAATAEAGAKGAAVPETAATETGATETGTTEAGTETGATDAGTGEAGATETVAIEAAAAPDRAPRPAPAETGLFARYTRDYVTGHDGHQITILQAGCTTADGDLGVSVLRDAGADIAVSLIDDDQPVTRAALAADGSLAGCVQGDLRTVPLPPRSHDIVLCALLLQRIRCSTGWSPRSGPAGCCCCGSATGTVREVSSTGSCPRRPEPRSGANGGPDSPVRTRPCTNGCRPCGAFRHMRSCASW
jgi:hypothetical protein